MPVDTDKAVIIEEINQKHKAATMSADTWIQSQAQTRSQMEKYGELIQDVSARQKSMEQQVKNINRILASQDIEHISDSMKVGLDDLRKEMMGVMKDKEHSILNHVEADIGGQAESKALLIKRVNELEQRMATTINMKFEEARKDRHSFRVDLDALRASVDEYPGIINAVKTSVDLFDHQIQDIKKDLKGIKSTLDVTTVEQDKLLAKMTAEIRLSQETARDTLEADTKAAAKNINKNVQLLEDRMKGIMPAIEKETHDRLEQCKQIFDRISDKLHEEKQANERSIHAIDGEIERRLALVLRNIGYVKAVVQEERTLRESAVHELTLSLASEKKQRDLDEQRLLSMIHACTSTMSKLHKAT